MSNLFEKLRGIFVSPNHTRTLSLLIVLVIAASIPLIVIVSQKQQDIRQHAMANPDAVVPADRVGNSCTGQGDCAPHTTCLDGICKVNSGSQYNSNRCCGVDSQCTDDQACTGYDGYCGSGKKCGDPHYRNLGEDCGAHRACSTNLTCTNGTCKWNNGHNTGSYTCCANDSNCSSTQACTGTESNCQSGNKCVNRPQPTSTPVPTTAPTSGPTGPATLSASPNPCSATATVSNNSTATFCPNVTLTWSAPGVPITDIYVSNECGGLSTPVYAQGGSSGTTTIVNQVCYYSQATNGVTFMLKSRSDPYTTLASVRVGATGPSTTGAPTTAPTSAPTTGPTGCTPIPKNQGNANGDCAIDVADFTIWRNEYTQGSGTQADFNGDGTTNLLDFATWRNTFYNLH